MTMLKKMILEATEPEMAMLKMNILEAVILEITMPKREVTGSDRK